MRKAMTIFGLLAAAGVAPAAAQELDPVGTFEFETVVQGQTIGGSMEITQSESGFTGTIWAEGQPEIPIQSVTVDGALMTIFAMIPEAGELIIELEFDGDEFAGSWALGFDGAELSGRRVRL